MINKDPYKNLTDVEKSDYKFDFCILCPLYECELVKEYIPPKNTSKGDTVVLAKTKDTINDEITENTSRVPVDVKVKENDEINESDIEYIQNELKNGCAVKGLVRIDCDRKKVADGNDKVYVADGIGYDFEINIREYTLEIESESEYNEWKPERQGKWEPKQPVYISAQTGQGKNTLVEKTLLPYVRELNYKNHTDQKVLIISNRIALRMQIENRLRQGIIIQDNDQDEEFFVNYKGYHADVIMYQNLLNMAKSLEKKQKTNSSRYIFVVCDEAHFFTSDAMFNPHTERILRTIVNTFKDAIRIYMTATPYECLPYIEKMEKQWKSNDEREISVFYHYKREYRYLDIKYYTDFEELYDLIVKSVNKEKEKWLIFIDNKEKCKEVKEELEKYGDENENPMKATIEIIENGKPKKRKVDKIFAVDTDKKREEDYQKMVLDEKLNKDTFVLISTSVLDNGVNLTGIKNIVVSDMSKVKCLQMVGRARVESEDDKKTLYIKRFDSAYVENRIAYLKKQQDAYHSFNLAYKRHYDPSDKDGKDNNYEKKFLDKYYNDQSKDWEDAKHWFGRDRERPEQVYPNEIARSLVKKSIEMYEFILTEMQINDKEQKVPGQKYLEYQLSWFGKKYDVKNDITLTDKDACKKELINFLESYVNRVDKNLSEAEQDKFSEEFTKKHDRAFERRDPNKNRVYGISKINDLLKDHCINYKVVSKQEKTSEGKRSYWEVVRHDSEREKADTED